MDLVEWPPKGNERHPWEKARFRFFSRIFQDAGLDRRPISILDVGAGDGWFSRELLKGTHPETIIICWDINYTSDDIQKFSSISDQRIQYVSHRPKEKYDLLILMDVLEHIEEDANFLSLITIENIHDRSFIMISLPAWQTLYSQHDKHLNHLRRYNPRQCRALLERHGLKIMRCGGLFHSLLLPRLLKKILDLLITPSKVKGLGDWQYGNAFTTLVEKGLSWDNRISRLLSKLNWDVPGLSWWALCKKQ
jgi:hypothetical protein